MIDWGFLRRFEREYIDPMFNVKWNRLHFPLDEVTRPANAKCMTADTMRCTVEICLWCWNNGYVFATEVKMHGMKRRADIIIPDLLGSQVIEIMDSESEASLMNKQLDYRKRGLECVGVPANDYDQAIRLIRLANNL